MNLFNHNKLIVLVLVGLCFPFFNAYAGQVSIERIAVPQYKSHGHVVFDGVGIDGGTRKVSFAGNNSWCEAPHDNGHVNFQSGFMAPTEGFRLTAVASYPGGILVYDQLKNTIMANRNNYKVTRAMGQVTGMAYHKGSVYLADPRSGKVYVLQLSGTQAIVKATYAGAGITGLASDGENIYAAYGGAIGVYDETMNLKAKYRVGVSLTGLTAVNTEILIGTASDGREAYRIRLQ